MLLFTCSASAASSNSFFFNKLLIIEPFELGIPNFTLFSFSFSSFLPGPSFTTKGHFGEEFLPWVQHLLERSLPFLPGCGHGFVS